MSIFEKGLSMFKTAAKDLKDIEDEPIPEDIKIEATTKPAAKKTGIDEIKAQAREKAEKEMNESNNIQLLLEKFKKFLSRDKRTKMISFVTIVVLFLKYQNIILGFQNNFLLY